MIPFLDLARSHASLTDKFEAAFRQVMAHGRFILGPEVRELESALEARLGVAHAVGVSSGTDALLAVLMALDVGPGDEVLVPPLTFYATAGAVVRLGATPVFADVDPHTLLLDSASALGRKTENTRAVIPVHLFGQCADVSPYQAANIDVVEDAAQALGATDEEGTEAGAQGRAGCFSFFPTKPLGGFGDGGLITTSDDALAERLRRIRVHGAKPKFHHESVGGNFRLDTLQAAMLLVKLPHLDAWNEECRRLAHRYRDLLDDGVQQGDVRFVSEAGGDHVYHQCVVRVNDREALRSGLSERNIGSAVYYPEPLHLQPCFSDLGYGPGDLPHAEEACADVLALPCFPGLTDEEQTTIARTIADFYQT